MISHVCLEAAINLQQARGYPDRTAWSGACTHSGPTTRPAAQPEDPALLSRGLCRQEQQQPLGSCTTSLLEMLQSPRHSLPLESPSTTPKSLGGGSDREPWQHQDLHSHALQLEAGPAFCALLYSMLLILLVHLLEYNHAESPISSVRALSAQIAPTGAPVSSISAARGCPGLLAAPRAHHACACGKLARLGLEHQRCCAAAGSAAGQEAHTAGLPGGRGDHQAAGGPGLLQLQPPRRRPRLHAPCRAGLPLSLRAGGDCLCQLAAGAPPGRVQGPWSVCRPDPSSGAVGSGWNHHPQRGLQSYNGDQENPFEGLPHHACGLLRKCWMLGLAVLQIAWCAQRDPRPAGARCSAVQQCSLASQAGLSLRAAWVVLPADDLALWELGWGADRPCGMLAADRHGWSSAPHVSHCCVPILLQYMSSSSHGGAYWTGCQSVP